MFGQQAPPVFVSLGVAQSRRMEDMKCVQSHEAVQSHGATTRTHGEVKPPNPVAESFKCELDPS